MEIINLISTATIFYFPAAMANVGAVISRFVPGFNQIETPVDLGFSYRGIRLVGDHKKLGGFIFGIIFGTFIALIKYLYFDQQFLEYRLVNYDFWRYISMYAVMSFGAVSGDIIESVIKRQLNISPHAPWIPFDEIDHTSLSMTLAAIFFGIPWAMVLLVIVVYFFWHVLANIVGYQLRIKKVPY